MDENRLVAESASDELRERLRPVVMRQLRWLAGVGVAMGVAVLGGVLVHTLWPHSGLLAEIPFAFVLFPLYKYAQFISLERMVAKDPAAAELAQARIRGNWFTGHPLTSMAISPLVLVLGLIAYLVVHG